MSNKKDVSQELKDFQKFLKGKKITCEALSKEMGFSQTYVIKVFNGMHPPSERFMSSLFKSTERLLQKDLNLFYNNMRGSSWDAFLMESLQYRRHL